MLPTADENPFEASDVHDENGVDRSLVRSALARTPSERLAIVDGILDLVALTRPKDQLMLMHLVATLEERKKQRRPG